MARHPLEDPIGSGSIRPRRTVYAPDCRPAVGVLIATAYGDGWNRLSALLCPFRPGCGPATIFTGGRTRPGFGPASGSAPHPNLRCLAWRAARANWWASTWAPLSRQLQP